MLDYAHHSGRFDRTPQSLADALVGLTRHAELIGCTEVGDPHRAHAAARALHHADWGLFRPGRFGEVGLAYDTTRYRVLHHAYPVVSAVRTFRRGGKRRPPFRALFVLLEDVDTGDTVLVSVGHTPSHVQASPRRWRHNARARKHRTGLRAWRRELRHLTELWKPTGGRIVSMDLNLDTRRKWVRAYLARMFPTLRLVRDPGRTKGTHGHRAIDVVLVDRKWLHPVRWWKGRRLRVKATRDSDHRTILARLRRKH